MQIHEHDKIKPNIHLPNLDMSTLLLLMQITCNVLPGTMPSHGRSPLHLAVDAVAAPIRTLSWTRHRSAELDITIMASTTPSQQRSPSHLAAASRCNLVGFTPTLHDGDGIAPPPSASHRLE
ncbi:hypothetical protein CFC21_041128 [Triticum aestivum]|uniref:Uncharacterized protein n=2 Tax=Triticum aestivum TaxID=4565 RepID=A0A3B6FL82_WHEAT|nr:hypothetical protein CFC21_041128 [Triticum aestivum]